MALNTNIVVRSKEELKLALEMIAQDMSEGGRSVKTSDVVREILYRSSSVRKALKKVRAVQ